MIANLTPAEYDAVIHAFALADAEWESQADTEGEKSVSLTARRRAIERAQDKIRQIAP